MAMWGAMWGEAQADLHRLTAKDRGLQLRQRESDKRASLGWVVRLYADYISVTRRLDEVHDQLVHPQKRLLVRGHGVDGSVGGTRRVQSYVALVPADPPASGRLHRPPPRAQARALHRAGQEQLPVRVHRGARGASGRVDRVMAFSLSPSYLDDLLIERKLTHQDLEVPSPRYYRHENEVQLQQRREFIDSVLGARGAGETGSSRVPRVWRLGGRR